MLATNGRVLEDKVDNTIDSLDSDTSSIVIDYLVDKTISSYVYQRGLSFFDNAVALYTRSATQATHNLSRHIEIDKSIEFFKENPSALNAVVSVTDIHGQLFVNTPLRILAAMGEFNSIEVKEEKPHGLVHLLRPCFPNINDYKKQLKEQFPPNHELVTKKRMERYINAIKILINDAITIERTIKSTRSSRIKLKEALKPDHKDTIAIGLAWNGMQFFVDLLDMIAVNLEKLGGRAGGDGFFFVDDVAWSILQARCSLPDLEILAEGISNVRGGHLPTRIDFSNGEPEILKGIGDEYFFGADGEKYTVGRRCIHADFWDRQTFLDLLLNQRNDIDALTDRQRRVMSRCLVQ